MGRKRNIEQQGASAQLTRIFQILNLLSGEGGMNAPDLAQRCEVTRRTIFRDLRALEAGGVPVVFDRGSRRYHLKRSFVPPPVNLTEDEILALVCVAGKLTRTLQSPMLREVLRALEKFRSQVSPGTLQKLHAMEDRLEFHMAGMEDGRACADVYAQVDLALQRRRVLLCRYEAAGGSGRPGSMCGKGAEGAEGSEGAEGAEGCCEPGVRSALGRLERFELRPYGIFWSKGASYVVGHHSGRDACRTLRLSRFVAVELTDRKYRIPESFSLRQYLGNAWGIVRGEESHDVELRFTGVAAQLVEEGQWHATQSTQRLPDGSLQFTCHVDGLAEIAPWVLSMGPQCQVIAPAALREEVIGLARQTLVQYEQGPGKRRRALISH